MYIRVCVCVCVFGFGKKFPKKYVRKFILGSR